MTKVLARFLPLAGNQTRLAACEEARLEETAKYALNERHGRIVAIRAGKSNRAWVGRKNDLWEGSDERALLRESIWETLRSMPQKGRDAAVLDAINRADRVVIAAIRHSPSPLLTGTLHGGRRDNHRALLKEHTPEMVEELVNIDSALTG